MRWTGWLRIGIVVSVPVYACVCVSYLLLFLSLLLLFQCFLYEGGFCAGEMPEKQFNLQFLIIPSSPFYSDWLVVRGARFLVINSRRGVTTSYQAYRIRYGYPIVKTQLYNSCECYLAVANAHKLTFLYTYSYVFVLVCVLAFTAK